LTNGTLITPAVADALAALQAASRYSLEIRISWTTLMRPKTTRCVPSACCTTVAYCATIPTGWWTTCLEILPEKERVRGRCAGVLRTAHGPPSHWRGLSRMPGL
jgi:hypothetical protein